VQQVLAPVSLYFTEALGQYLKDRSIDELGLKNLLSTQRAAIRENAPAGLADFPLFAQASEASTASQGHGTAQGRKGNGEAAGDTSPAGIHDDTMMKTPPLSDGNGSPFGKILPWIILGLTSLALLWFLSKSGADTAVDEVQSTQNEGGLGSSGDTLAAAGKDTYTGGGGEGGTIEISLPDSTLMITSSNGFAGTFYEMVTGSTIDTVQSCTLDGVDFMDGTAELVQGSEHQLRQLARIMKAFQAVTIRIVAHTDNGGSATDNMKLSYQRADAVQNWLIENGIKPGRVSIFGKGQEEPIVSSETEQGREQNRRIEIFILDK
jgi:outer membrane protein OmpA-like peptidoglycan-associated protein